MKQHIFLLFRFLVLEALFVFGISSLYYRANIPLLTCISLAFCSAFFLGRIDSFLFKRD